MLKTSVLGDSFIKCNKCNKTIRYLTGMMTLSAVARHKTKKHYCGNCIEERLESYCEEGY